MKNTKFILSIILLVFVSCMEQETIDLEYFYEYDKQYPLDVIVDTLSENLFHISYNSVNNNRVTALLSFPANSKKPYPLAIIQHGLGDNKNTDYMMLGDSILSGKGFAVFRIDFAMHGERVKKKYKFKGIDYTLRDAIKQTVFDLRRGLDYLNTLPQIDSTKTGFIGISLGGIAGTVFCGVDERVEVPVICIAGGGLRAKEGVKGFGNKVTSMMAPIEPLNFVEKISPRPLLFINAEDDEVIPKPMAMVLHSKAEEPKEIIWYKSKHHINPYKAFNDSAEWLIKYLHK
jgi:cephalosporin-C deacetylase-like acetyl esterase